MRNDKKLRWNLRLFTFVLLLALAGCGSESGAELFPDKETESGSVQSYAEQEETASDSVESTEESVLLVAELDAKRLSRSQIQLSWSDSLDGEVREYIVKKRRAVNGSGVGKWAVVDYLVSDGQADGAPVITVDTLNDQSIQQFEYTVVPLTEGDSDGQAQAGTTVLASNLQVCLDPGHFAGANLIQGIDSYGYAEGDITLKLAQELRRVLQESYGISVCMTRESGSISLGGYSDGVLDGSHLALRGRYAGETGSDLFLSLHTNANRNDANGYDTCSQPISINKPILIANTVAVTSSTAIAVGNAIGENLSKVGFSMGLATASEFSAGMPGDLPQWSDEYNDSLDVPGKLFCRWKETGAEDYYGVLRGAAEVGVPGSIIEHGMHTVPEVRRAAMEGDLIQRWAEADANGIAYGFGFATERKGLYIVETYSDPIEEVEFVLR